MRQSTRASLDRWNETSRLYARQARRWFAEYNSACADPEDSAPLWPLAVILVCLFALGCAVTVYSLLDHKQTQEAKP